MARKRTARILRGMPIFLAALHVAASASADFIGVTDDRLLTAGCVSGFLGQCYFYTTVAPTTPFSFFDETLDIHPVFTTQTSSFAPNALEARGTISVSLPHDADADIYAFSNFQITFDVDVETPISLSGVLTPVAGIGQAGVALLTGTTAIFAVNDEQIS